MLWLAGFAIVALTVSCCPRLAPAPNPHYVSKRSTAATSSTNNSSSSSSSSSLKSSSDPNKAAASDGAPGTPDEKRALLASKHSKRVTSVIVRPNKGTNHTHIQVRVYLIDIATTTTIKQERDAV